MLVLGVTPWLWGRTIGAPIYLFRQIINAPYYDLPVHTKILLVITFFFNITSFCLHESHLLAEVICPFGFDLFHGDSSTYARTPCLLQTA